MVHMASCAPLLARRRHSNWTPDLIHFSGTQVFPTLNPTVQQLFSLNSGDTHLPATIEPSTEPARFTASTVRDSRTGDIVVKLVNGDSAPRALTLHFARTRGLPATALRTVFADPSADIVNEDGKPPAATPQTATIRLAPDLPCEAPANSLTIVRLKTK